MVKIKVNAKEINRWGKKYFSEKWVIEVLDSDLIHFKWFEKEKKITLKNIL